MLRKSLALATPLLLLTHLTTGIAHGETTTDRAYFITPKDGEKISGPVTVRFGLQGYGVAPAGVDKLKTGHHHLLIDVSKLPALDKPLPKDEKHRHFGDGQTEVSLTLPKGRHTLQLVLGDKNHVPVGENLVSETITVEVE